MSPYGDSNLQICQSSERPQGAANFGPTDWKQAEIQSLEIRLGLDESRLNNYMVNEEQYHKQFALLQRTCSLTGTEKMTPGCSDGRLAGNFEGLAHPRNVKAVNGKRWQ